MEWEKGIEARRLGFVLVRGYTVLAFQHVTRRGDMAGNRPEKPPHSF